MDNPGASTSARAQGLYAYHPAAAHHPLIEHQLQQHPYQQYYTQHNGGGEQPYTIYQPVEPILPPPSAGGTDGGGSFDDGAPEEGGAQASGEAEGSGSGSRRQKSSTARFGVACLKCRSRKVKCDGQKPVCENCIKKGFECTFDEVPRTRGPDKKPGRKRRTAAQKAADTKLEEELRAQGIKVPVKAKRKRTPPAAPSEFEVPASAEGTTSKGVKSDRGLQPWSVLLPSVQSRPTEQPEVSSSSSAAGPSVGDGGVKEERPDLVHATTSHEHLSGQWGLAPPTMDDYMRRAQQLNGPVPSEPYCTGQQQQQQQQHLPGASSGHPSYTRYAPPPHPPPLVAGQHGLQPATHDGPPAYSAGLAPPSRYDGSHAQSSPVAPPQHLQPYPQPTPSPQMPFTTYAPARGSRKSAAASSAQHDVEVHGGQHLAHSPYAPQPQTLQPAQLAPLADLQRPMSTFQTPSHVDLPVPVLPQARPHPDQAAADQQHPNGADPGPRAVNLATPSRPPFYAPPNGDVTYFEHPYAPPKETNHRILDHLIERVVEHGFILPDTAGSALRARPDGSGSYVAAAEGLPSSNGTASEYGHHRSEEDVRQAHAEGQGRELVRSQSPGSNRLVLNDLLLPKDLADSSFAAQAFRTHPFRGFPQPPQQQSASLTAWQLAPTLPKQPTSDYPRKIWWDALLGQYGNTRREAYARIMGEIGHLFRVSNHWTAFFHIPRFIAILHQPQRREQLQPALVYAVLALSTQLSSWDGPGGKGFPGRLLGLKLNEQAHANFWSSWNSGWIDADLAKAAFLMALYEISCHPIHSDARSAQAMTLLDNVLRTLQLCSLDADDPRSSRFAPGEVPCIPASAAKVPCTTYPEKVLDSEMNTTNSPFWAACPRWSTASYTPTDAEIVKDESRRLAWSSCALAASISMYSHNVWRERADDWYISNCENFALLFPGELLFDPAHAKSNVWSLYYTTALLWNFAIRSHYDPTSPAQVKRDKAFEVWATTVRLETYFQESSTPTSGDNIRPVPWPEQISKLAYGWQSRDWLVTARFLVADSVKEADQNNVGGTADMIHSATAREWLTKQSEVAKSLMPASDSFGKHSTALINHRPILLWWLLQQLARILELFDSDPTFTATLDVARLDFCPIIEIFAQLYPSVGLYEVVVHRIVSRLNEASAMASGAYQQAFPSSNPLLPRFPPFYFSAANLTPHDRVLEMMARDPLPDGSGFEDDSPPYQFATHQPQPQVKHEVYH